MFHNLYCWSFSDPPVQWEWVSGQHRCFSLSSVFCLCGSGEQGSDGGGSIYPPTSSTLQKDIASWSAADCWNFCQPEEGRGHTTGKPWKNFLFLKIVCKLSLFETFFEANLKHELKFSLVSFQQSSLKEGQGAQKQSNPSPPVPASVPPVEQKPRSSSPVRKTLDSPPPAPFLSPANCCTESEAESLLEELQRGKELEGRAGETGKSSGYFQTWC